MIEHFQPWQFGIAFLMLTGLIVGIAVVFARGVRSLYRDWRRGRAVVTVDPNYTRGQFWVPGSMRDKKGAFR